MYVPIMNSDLTRNNSKFLVVLCNKFKNYIYALNLMCNLILALKLQHMPFTLELTFGLVTFWGENKLGALKN